MNTHIVLAIVAMVLFWFVCVFLWASRFARVRPNQVMIISGRKNIQPDGTVAGFRIVKSGATFVLPVIERVDVLSLEVFTVELPWSKSRVANGRTVEAVCSAQMKINNDDASIALATEYFLGKSQPEIQKIIQPILEKHVSLVLGSLSSEEATQNHAAYSANVQTSATADLAGMGLNLVSFTIRDTRAA
jgi:flotillin